MRLGTRTSHQKVNFVSENLRCEHMQKVRTRGINEGCYSFVSRSGVEDLAMSILRRDAPTSGIERHPETFAAHINIPSEIILCIEVIEKVCEG